MRAPTNTSSKPWLGYFFIAYALFCLGLSLSLEQWWPSQVTSPSANISVKKTLPAKETPVDIKQMKQGFFTLLLPAIIEENQKIDQQRQRLLTLQGQQKSSDDELTLAQQALLHTLATQYRVPSAMDNQAVLSELLLRIEQVPASMVLAQAAIESAWGRSRFATEANNYFGQWCFTQGCGIVPKHRNSGARHEVARFDSLNHAIAAYLRNINSHPAYAEVRSRREQTRQRQEPLNSLEMIEGLQQYSARGDKYIDELRSIIEFNQLRKFDL
jgi:Bax protein